MPIMLNIQKYNITKNDYFAYWHIIGLPHVPVVSSHFPIHRAGSGHLQSDCVLHSVNETKDILI